MKKDLNEMTNNELWQLFPIILSEHKPEWEEQYLIEKSVLEQSIGKQTIVRINHIGSTIIPGLIAKPTIDVLIEIENDTDTAKLISNMKTTGYRYVEQPKNPPPHMMFLKGYTPQGFKGQAFHIHIRYQGDWDELYFRDYLLLHPDVAAEYAKLKLSLKDNYEYDRDSYTKAKTGFIKRITRLARNEMLHKYR